MAFTLRIESFKNINLRERTTLSRSSAVAADRLEVASTEGYETGQTIYIGQLAREGCERAIVLSVSGKTTVNLASPLERSHEAFETVTAVLGDRIRIYRAADLDGKPPTDEAFSVLSHRSIDPDQQQTYFTDSTGSAGYWYKTTYWNEATSDETELSQADAFRGDDYGRYAHTDEIRSEAGFEGAHNLKDYAIDQQRRFAEAEINTALSVLYSTPFKPVPEIIHALTVKLASAMLKYNAYGDSASEKLLKDARALLEGYRLGKASITDDDGQSVSTASSVNGWPDESAPRAFYAGQKF